MLIIGEEHSIVGWFVTRSESWEELRPGLTAFRDRLERLGTLDQLAAWWSDRCCDGCLDVTRHALVHGSRIWRAPYKGCFHGINGVAKTGDEGVPLQKFELGTGLFRAVREIPDSAWYAVELAAWYAVAFLSSLHPFSSHTAHPSHPLPFAPVKISSAPPPYACSRHRNLPRQMLLLDISFS